MPKSIGIQQKFALGDLLKLLLLLRFPCLQNDLLTHRRAVARPFTPAPTMQTLGASDAL